MNSEQYLLQAVQLAHTLTSLNKEKQRLAELSTATGGFNYSQDMVIGSKPQSARFENYSVSKVDIENEIEDDIRHYWKLHSEIRHVISQVEDLEVQSILRLRYLTDTPVDVIASQFHVSRKTIERRLDKGFEEVAMITGCPVPPKQRMPAREREHTIAREMLKEVYQDVEREGQ